MKKLTVFALSLSLLCTVNNLTAQSEVEKATKDILTAYKNRDAALLKEYVAGFFAMAINDEFFDSKDGAPLVKVAQQWDGSIKEIRYTKGDMMGKEVMLANAYISDNAEGKLNIVTLTRHDGNSWKAFALGLNDMPQEEFEKGNTTIPKEEVVSKSKKDHSEFSVEMANGEKYEKPTTKKLTELLKTLNDDNFYLILNSTDGFLQASTSEQGYIIQYSDKSGMFEAEEYFSLEKMTKIFAAYIDKLDWKNVADNWLEM